MHRVTVVIALLAAGGGALSGSAPLSAAVSPWTRYDKTTGLVDNHVQVIARDEDGSLWIGTRRGLSRFDGVKWRNLTVDDGLPGDDISTIYLGSRGEAWIGTNRGFGIYRDGEWDLLGLPGAEAGERVSVVGGKDGTVWFGYSGGLMSFHEEGGLVMREELRGTPVTALLGARSGGLWVGTENGVSFFDGTHWTRYAEREGIAPGAVAALLEDSRGTLWCASEGGLSEYDGIGWTSYGSKEGLPEARVTALAEDRKGRIWVGTVAGAGWYDGYEWIWLDEKSGNPADEVLALQADLNGSIWMGTPRGLTKYDTSWLALDSVGYEEYSPRGPLLRRDDGVLYLAAEEGLLEKEGRQVEHLGPGDGLTGRVTLLFADAEDGVWIGSDRGLYIYSYGELRHITPPEYETEIRRHRYGAESVQVRHFDLYHGLKDEKVTALWGTGEEEMWVGTPKGLSIYSEGRWDLLEESGPLAGSEITALEGVTGEVVWVGTPEGLWSRAGGEWSSVEGVKGRSVRTLLLDREGTLWAGTDSGVSLWDGGSWRHVEPGAGLAGSAVAAIFQDGAGSVWLGTEAGVGKFNGEYWSSFSETDGLHVNSITSIIEDGEELWFGSPEGVTLYRPDRAPPDTWVTNVPREVVGASSYLFEFAASDFETPLHRMRYSWKLDDGEWTSYGTKTRTMLTDLANGSHTFAVRSMDLGLNTDPSPAVVRFEVDTGLFDLEVVDAKFEDLFASLYQYYSSGADAEKEPVARVDVKNRYDRPIRAKVSFFLPGLMDFPGDRVVTIGSGETLPVALRVELSEEVLRLEKTASRQALVGLHYSLRGEPKEASLTYPVTVVERHSMSWDEPGRAGLYVTHLDEAVEHFARGVVAQFREDEERTIIYDNLLRAIELFDALGAHGVRYVADPENPYGSIAGGGGVLDLIRFPRETLTIKSGDCDDVSVLYAALLENIGIDTALVDVTDHVFVMFDTGLKRRQAGQVARDTSQLYIDGRGRVWVPVETTLLGQSFSEAWKTGAEMLAERKYEIIETKEAWKKYPPVHLPDKAEFVAVPTRDDIWPLFAEDIKVQERTLISERVRKIRQRLEEDPDDVLSLNSLGILLAKNGYLRQAEAHFRRVVALAPAFAGGYSNLANVLYERERYEEAVEGYLEALELDAASPEVHVELALTYCEIGRFDKARVHYRLAMELGASEGGTSITAGERREEE